ncbi:MAG: hypothetical protein HFG77_06605 [Hungatella sp.]|nr:hypothetical protein [Hungatella sp.]
MKKYQNIPGFLSICLSVAAMTAGGGGAVEISKTWKWEFLFPEEKISFRAEAFCESLPLPVPEESKKEIGESGDVPLEGDMLPDSRTIEKIETLEEKIKDERSPERLNLAFYFDDGDQEEDISHSYGARIYQSLSEKDSIWIQGIYSHIETPPDQMAAAQGMDIGGLTSWNRVIVTFRDGDGTPISGYSNAKEILSLASVFGYFQGWEDYDDFLEYAAALWNRSHAYQVSMSQVYYCEEECQYLEKPEGSQEEEESHGDSQDERTESAADGPVQPEGGSAQGGLEVQGSGTVPAGGGEWEGETPAGGLEVQGNGPAADRTGEEESQSPVDGEVQGNGTASSGTGEGESQSPVDGEVQGNGTASSGAGEGRSQSPGGGLDVQGNETVPAGGGEREGDPPEGGLEIQGNETVPASEGEREGESPEGGLEVQGNGNASSGTGNREEAASGQNGQGNDMELESASSGSGQGSAGEGAREGGENHQAGGFVETSESMENTSDGGTWDQNQENSQPVVSSENQEADQGGQESGKDSCQGHVDLNISIRITGIKEGQSLYEVDPAGKQDMASDSQWNGWDEAARSFCDTLAAQDWYELYGLVSSPSLYVSNPLTQSEIAFYLNKLPDTTSPKRQELVRQALSSVGRIPYYWGGKPSRGGLEGNGFGTITRADEDGRILKGLDCSGWISWVYWTAFGSPLPAQSTSGLVNCGRGIAKEELRAGDILIRTGEQPHVYLFLAWAEDGSMYLIHETTGYVNNVMIDTYDVELPYYRDLIGEE